MGSCTGRDDPGGSRLVGAVGAAVLAFQAGDLILQALHLGLQPQNRGHALLADGEQARDELPELRLGEGIRIEIKQRSEAGVEIHMVSESHSRGFESQDFGETRPNSAVGGHAPGY